MVPFQQIPKISGTHFKQKYFEQLLHIKSFQVEFNPCVDKDGILTETDKLYQP